VAGSAQYPEHPLVRFYVKRDAKGAWVKKAAGYASQNNASLSVVPTVIRPQRTMWRRSFSHRCLRDEIYEHTNLLFHHGF
jgi:hypothetical protein